MGRPLPEGAARRPVHRTWWDLEWRLPLGRCGCSVLFVAALLLKQFLMCVNRFLNRALSGLFITPSPPGSLFPGAALPPCLALWSWPHSLAPSLLSCSPRPPLPPQLSVLSDLFFSPWRTSHMAEGVLVPSFVCPQCAPAKAPCTLQYGSPSQLDRRSVLSLPSHCAEASRYMPAVATVAAFWLLPLNHSY